VTEQWWAGLTPTAAIALRGGFDDDAEVYQRTRPVCPPELFDDLMRLAHLSPGDRVLEIAPGTGQATVQLAERGLAITAVEFGASLAAVARRRLAAFPAVEVVTSAFEDWQPQDEQPWNAVIVFNALHYLAQLATQAGTRELGPEKAAKFLGLVRHRLETHGWPSLTATFVGFLSVAIRR